MNITDLIVGGILVILIVLAACKIISDRKKGIMSCGHRCSECHSGCGHAGGCGGSCGGNCGAHKE